MAIENNQNYPLLTTNIIKNRMTENNFGHTNQQIPDINALNQDHTQQKYTCFNDRSIFGSFTDDKTEISFDKEIFIPESSKSCSKDVSCPQDVNHYLGDSIFNKAVLEPNSNFSIKNTPIHNTVPNPVANLVPDPSNNFQTNNVVMPSLSHPQLSSRLEISNICSNCFKCIEPNTQYLQIINLPISQFGQPSQIRIQSKVDLTNINNQITSTLPSNIDNSSTSSTTLLKQQSKESQKQQENCGDKEQYQQTNQKKRIPPKPTHQLSPFQVTKKQNSVQQEQNLQHQVTSNITFNGDKIDEYEKHDAIFAITNMNEINLQKLTSIMNRDNERLGLKKVLMLIYDKTDILVKDLVNINDSEKEMLKSLLKRKFSLEIEAENFTSSVLTKINHYKNNSKTKRFEENYKLVFKRVYKYLIKKFAKDHKLKCRKSEQQKRFFDYYFNKGISSACLKLEGGNDCSPDKETERFMEYFELNPSTITDNYVEKIISSDKYMRAFEEYLNNDFIKDYMKKIESKISKIVENCLEIYKNEGLTKVKENIEKNRKYKMPWTIGELETARISVCDKVLEKRSMNPFYS